MAAPDPYARRIYNGELMDNATIVGVQLAEIALGYKLTIHQGVGEASASGGSHRGLNGEGGRAIDIDDWDGDRKDRVLKDIGFIGFQREDLPGVWSAHGHYVLVLEDYDNRRGIDPVAFNQIAEFYAGGDGLVGTARDNSYRAKGRPLLTLEEYRRFHAGEGWNAIMPETNVTRARDEIVKARHNLREAIVELEKVPEDRTAARDNIPEIRELVRACTTQLETLPQR